MISKVNFKKNAYIIVSPTFKLTKLTKNKMTKVNVYEYKETKHTSDHSK